MVTAYSAGLHAYLHKGILTYTSIQTCNSKDIQIDKLLTHSKDLHNKDLDISLYKEIQLNRNLLINTTQTLQTNNF